jgi:hypothetical protein
MRSSRLRTKVLLAAFLLAGAASAQEAGHDEVTLKNGGSIRGTVVSSEPGVSVKIVEMGQKEPRMIPWAQVADVERDKYGSKPAAVEPGSAGPGYAQPAPFVPAQRVPVRAEPPTEPPESSLANPGVVRLHVESPVPVQVEKRGVNQGSVNGYGFEMYQTVHVCASPCDKIIDGSQGQWFEASGDFPGGKEFRFDGMKGDVDLKVRPGSRGLRGFGVTSIVLGSGAFLLGGTLTLLGGFSTYNTNSAGVTTYGLSSETRVGLAILGTGAAVLVGGIVATVAGGSHFDLHARDATATTTAAAKPRYRLGQF